LVFCGLERKLVLVIIITSLPALFSTNQGGKENEKGQGEGRDDKKKRRD
jgi:hypothetical protein